MDRLKARGNNSEKRHPGGESSLAKSSTNTGFAPCSLSVASVKGIRTTLVVGVCYVFALKNICTLSLSFHIYKWEQFDSSVALCERQGNWQCLQLSAWSRKELFAQVVLQGREQQV